MTTDRALELAENALHERRSYARLHNMKDVELETERALDELGALRTLGTVPRVPDGCYDALEAAHDAYAVFESAPTPFLAAHYLVELANAMSDLASWHPDFNIDTGRIGHVE